MEQFGPSRHAMTFKRFGRSHHLRIRNAGDLEHIRVLDEAHWLATGAPVSSLNMDATFLSLVDSDHNGRIMCFEIREAVTWLLATLRDTGNVKPGNTILQMDAICADCSDGRQIHASAMKMLRQAKAEEEGSITLDQVRTVKQQVEKNPVSEGGVILPSAPEAEDVRTFLQDILDTVGGVPHPSGNAGVNAEKMEAFIAQCREHLEWLEQAEAPSVEGRNELLPFGEQTHEAFEAAMALRDKLAQYFAQCRAVALDARAAEHLLPTAEELGNEDLGDLDTLEELMRTSPLAPPNPGEVLDLEGPINPFYRTAVQNLREKVLDRMRGRETVTLSATDWENVFGLFGPYRAWIEAKAGVAVEKLGEEKIRGYLDERYPAAVEVLLTERRQTALVLDNIRQVEKLILYQAYLVPLVNNFVSFPHLYDPESRAAFEMGTLIIDGRHLTFSVKTENHAEHSKVAATSDIFVIYVEILDREGKRLYVVALPVTSSGKGNLCVGKRGVFHDVNGNESDARVIQILENPISISETLIAPFHRIGRILGGKIEAMTTSAEKRLDKAAAGALDASAPVAAPAPASAGPAAPRGLFAGGLLMGGGVALAALSSAAAYVTKTLADVGPAKIVLGVMLAVVAVVMPASIVAFLKLRRRDLSAILEGCGWAINARMRLTFRQGRVFTRRPRFPKGARGVRRWWVVALAVGLLAAAAAALQYAIRYAMSQ